MKSIVIKFLLFAAAILLSIWCGLGAHAQVQTYKTSDIKVAALTPDETSQMQAIVAARKDLDAKEAKLRDQITTNHLIVPHNSPDASTVQYPPEFAWTNGLITSWIGGRTTTNIGSDTFCIGQTAHTNYSYPCHATPVERAHIAQESEKQYRERRELEATQTYYRKGWTEGFQFSDDYKFIVPKEVTVPVQSNCAGGLSIIPAVMHY